MASPGKLAMQSSQRIRHLADVSAPEPVVISTYISIDPTRFATARNRAAEVESLMDEARSMIAGNLSHDAKNTLTKDLQRVRDWAHELDPAGARSVAVFCSSDVELFEVFRLAAELEPEVHIDTNPRIETLCAAMPAHAWCVFLVNRQSARTLRGSHDRLIDVWELEEEVHGQHDQGGWSQARYQRSVEKDAADHVQHACDRLLESFQRAPFDKLLVGCPAALWPEVDRALHSYLKERLVDRFDADVEHENPDSLLERVGPLIEQEERKEEAAVLDALAERLGRGERAASGVPDVTHALNEGRVEALLFEPGFDAEGSVCPRCGWVGTPTDSCPADGTALERRNLDGPMTRSAILQGASVREVRYAEPRRALGGPVAALLRY